MHLHANRWNDTAPYPEARFDLLRPVAQPARDGRTNDILHVKHIVEKQNACISGY
jgi:hypothetical protein